MLHYAGVGVRKAEPDQLNKCYRVGRYLAKHGWVLHTGMALWLLHLIDVYLSNGRDWVTLGDYEELSTTGGDYSKLKFWGLIEPVGDAEQEDDNPNGRGAGVWRPTDKGIAYALNRLSIPKYCFTYNDQLHSYSEELVSVLDVVAHKEGYGVLIDSLAELAYPNE